MKAAIKAMPALEKKSRKEIGAVFAKFANKDGRILRDKLTPAFNNLGVLVSAAEVNRFLVKELDFEGFVSFLGMSTVTSTAAVVVA